MLDYRQMEALAVVLEQGNFEKAADSLCITQSAVSQRIKQLEERLGCILLVRANPLYATEEGKRLLGHFKQVQFLEQEMMSQLPGSEETPFLTLPLAINADSLATWFFSALAPAAIKANLLLDIKIDDQDQTLNLLKQGVVMGCISTQSQPLQGGISTYIGTMPYIAVASPAFIKTHFSEGVTRQTLKRTPAVTFNHTDNLQHQYLKRFYRIQPGDYPFHTIPSAESFVDIAEQGMAYILVPQLQVAAQLKSGALQEIAPGNQLDVHLYWHQWRLQSPLSREISSALINRAQKLLPQLLDH
jgi:LysR family transcriptional regulator (chromosome initiation inhibitor)